MSRPPMLRGGRRRRHFVGPMLLGAMLIAAAGMLVELALGPLGLLRDPVPRSPSRSQSADAGRAEPVGRPGAGGGPSAEAARFALRPQIGPTPVHIRFGKPPRAGVLFDADSGEVLWRHNARRELPIASLTKMMTALLVVDRHPPTEKVRISRAARHTAGSAVGILPAHDRVRLEALLGGLLLVSGNDAAVALAEHDSGSVGAFVQRMNDRAAELGLSCTRFSSPHGLEDRDNFSCADDLAVLARADLSRPRIAGLVSRRDARYPFPIKGGRLFLSNNNPLMRVREPGIIGLKTGFTNRAGRCYVMIARRGGHKLGVVLLHSPDPIHQVRTLLRLGERARA